MSMQFKAETNPKHEKEVSLHRNTSIMVYSVPMIKHNHDVGTISFLCSILISIFLVINNIWFALKILNLYLVENGINILKNVSAVLIVIMMSQIFMFQE